MATRMRAVAVSMVVGAGRLHHQFELLRPTAFAAGRCVFRSRSIGGSRFKHHGLRISDRNSCGSPVTTLEFSLDGRLWPPYNNSLMLKAKFTTKRLALYLIVGAALAAWGFLAGCHRGAATRPVTKQVVVLGFDGADPKLAAKWMAEGKLPNLARLAREGTFKPLGTTNPPESPVAWASFATGLNPGGTGIYDFLKRDPETYLPELALVSRERPKFLWGLIPIKAPKVTNLRSGVPFYKAVADAGYKTTVIRMPLEFPPTTNSGRKVVVGLGRPRPARNVGNFFLLQLRPDAVGYRRHGIWRQAGAAGVDLATTRRRPSKAP